jgi:hypothetical protein
MESHSLKREALVHKGNVYALAAELSGIAACDGRPSVSALYIMEHVGAFFFAVKQGLPLDTTLIDQLAVVGRTRGLGCSCSRVRCALTSAPSPDDRKLKC